MSSSDERSKKGVIENAGGQVMCPVCHEHRHTLVWVMYRSPYETVTVHTEAMRVIHQTETDDRSGVGQRMTVLWRCRNGHQFGTVMVYEADADEPGLGVAALTTVWDGGDE